MYIELLAFIEYAVAFLARNSYGTKLVFVADKFYVDTLK